MTTFAERKCRSKVRHADKRKAKKKARKVAKAQKTELKAYHCNICKGGHMTKNMTFKRKA